MTKTLANHCLVASNQLADDYFDKSVIYIIRHDEQGAMGFMINRPNLTLSFQSLLEHLNISGHNDYELPLCEGGPLHSEFGMVLHTGQPMWNASMAVGENICLTTSRDIVQAIASDPHLLHYQIMLGFSAWSAGQLEQEVLRGDWFICEANLGLIFETPFAQRYQLASQQVGLNENWLSDQIGHS